MIRLKRVGGVLIHRAISILSTYESFVTSEALTPVLPPCSADDDTDIYEIESHHRHGLPGMYFTVDQYAQDARNGECEKAHVADKWLGVHAKRSDKRHRACYDRDDKRGSAKELAYRETA